MSDNPSPTMTITEDEAGQIERANASGLTPVMFVHGLFLLPSSWDRWAGLFEAAGYVALTPGWPDDPDTVAEANAHPEVFASKSVGQVADHFAAIAGSLSAKPVIIGHSFGGLLAQILAGRNRVFDETADSHARAGRAECQAGCVSCCYLMVMGAPIEILEIARHLLETRTPAEIKLIRQRLRKVADIPLDPALRVRSKTPCGLLENGRCIAYEQRPSVCRMALSQSRAACDSISCLRTRSASTWICLRADSRSSRL